MKHKDWFAVGRICFSKNLKELIKRRSVSLTKVSKETGVPMSTLSEWTAGREPKISEALLKICDFFGVSLEELVLSSKDRKSNGKSMVWQNILSLENQDYLVTFEKVEKIRNDHE